MPRGSWLYWASVLPGMGSRSIPTRRASSTSASSGRRAPSTRLRMAPRSTSSASPMSGASREGVNLVRQVTAKGRYARALAAVTQWCRDKRHRPIDVPHAHLSGMMRGHYAYYGVTGNSRRVHWYAHQVVRIWQRWLSRRYRQSAYAWKRLSAFLKQRPLLPPRIIHRYVTGSEALS